MIQRRINRCSASHARNSIGSTQRPAACLSQQPGAGASEGLRPPRSGNKIDLISISDEPGWDGLLALLQLRSGRKLCVAFAIPILVAAAAISCSAHDVVLAQATTSTQQVSPTFGGLSTPVTSTVTNCMMLCNSQVANCQAGCFVPAPPVPPKCHHFRFSHPNI
jgi:hypothetical protein